jgi:hypothetical protein
MIIDAAFLPRNLLKNGNQIHNFILCLQSMRTFVIPFSYGTVKTVPVPLRQEVTVPMVPIPVSQYWLAVPLLFLLFHLQHSGEAGANTPLVQPCQVRHH